ncbi:MAG: GNAT family N-acetyltransferase [Sandaracinaceae bacterium]|nr:GNAT family N-acetyltransferase [Sandaracinaceae bacterium]
MTIPLADRRAAAPSWRGHAGAADRDRARPPAPAHRGGSRGLRAPRDRSALPPAPDRATGAAHGRRGRGGLRHHPRLLRHRRAGLGLTVADRGSDAFLGTVALHPAPFGDALELFYAIVPRRWGEGLATESVKALLAAIPDADVVALTAPENEGSKRVALAAGLSDAGLHRPLGGPERHRFVRPATR